MPIMTRMRESMPVILISLVVAFLLTIVFEWGMDYLDIQSRSSDHVGRINGRTISYPEFAEMLRAAEENQKQQTKTDPDENQMVQIREQVWNSLVNQTLVDEQLRRLGITVTDEEIREWVWGPNPPEFLRRQFVDSTGVFNRAAYENAMRSPENTQALVNIEKSLRQQRLQEKLQSLLAAGIRASESEAFLRFVDQNTRLDAEYILFDPNKMVKDEEVEVTEADIRKYYNDHLDDYKVEETRKLKYVFFREEPSAQDTQNVLADTEDILRRVKEGADFVETASQYGQVQASQAFFKHGELSQPKEVVVFGAKAGQVVGPIKDMDGFHLIKILEIRQGKDEFVRASHVLIKPEDGDSAGALKLAREVLAAARRGEKFDALAAKYSKDLQSVSRGGELSWFGKGMMVKPFEEAAFGARVGQFVGPVKTQFGYHIVKVAEKSRREVRIADFWAPVKPTSQTRNTILQRAQDFAYVAGKDGFSEAGAQLGFTVSETPAFTKDAAIPGFGFNKSLSRFAFEGSVGDVSDVITVQFGYGVFMISDAKPAGIKPLDEVKDAVRVRAIREQKVERLKELTEQVRNSLRPTDSLGTARVSHPGIVVQRTGAFSPTAVVPGVGRDHSFIGAVTMLKVGEISKPVEGARGYYLIELLSRTPIDSAMFQAQRGNIMAQITQEKRSRFVTEWLEQLKGRAEIEDNRDLFYR